MFHSRNFYYYRLFCANKNKVVSSRTFLNLHNITTAITGHQLSQIQNGNGLQHQWNKPFKNQEFWQHSQFSSRNNGISPNAKNVYCKLDDGTPIFVVDDKLAFNGLIEVLIKCTKSNEEIIGIDAEWGPYFVAQSEERMSIIQIATSNAVYIVDIQRLTEENTLTEEEWINFFRTLFCSEKTMKIGYAFRNDIRVLKKTFPFVGQILINSQNILCLYTLLQKISRIPNASKIIFGANPPQKLKLFYVVDHFLDIQLSKGQKQMMETNWCSRPLTTELKKYAAMDAYSLIKLYYKILPNFKRLNADQQISLQKCALIKIVAVTKTGQYFISK